MVRFIFLSMAFIAVSFFAVPAYFGINEQHQNLIQTASIEPAADTLTFQEIYALADESLMADPSALNAIAPAAGDEQKPKETFSYGFSGKEDSALAQ